MTSDEMFNWPDGDVILRSTHGTESRDFRVHKIFLSFASPVFKDMFKLPQPSSPSSNVDVVDVADSPQALELILWFIYPCRSPVIDDLTLLSEVLILADKYDIEAARSRLRPSLVGFAKTEPLRMYAIACRLGLEAEMKIASSYTMSIDLPGLTQLPDEFKFVPATEYQRLVHLHARYRKEVVAIADRLTPTISSVIGGAGFYYPPDLGQRTAGQAVRRPVTDCIIKGIPLDYESFTLALKRDYGFDVEACGVGHVIHSILDQANGLRLTV